MFLLECKYRFIRYSHCSQKLTENIRTHEVSILAFYSLQINDGQGIFEISTTFLLFSFTYREMAASLVLFSIILFFLTTRTFI